MLRQSPGSRAFGPQPQRFHEAPMRLTNTEKICIGFEKQKGIFRILRTFPCALGYRTHRWHCSFFGWRCDSILSSRAPSHAYLTKGSVLAISPDRDFRRGFRMGTIGKSSEAVFFWAHPVFAYSAMAWPASFVLVLIIVIVIEEVRGGCERRT